MNSQPAPAEPSAAAPILLSPFEVNTDKDSGFVASSSLAGGRLAGELKDTPVAYSVLTKDFIDALQLTDLTEMSRWAPNSYDVPENGDAYGTGSDLFISSRGVSSNGPQRNFFPVNFNFDSYNIERLDLARGPNAILFGSSGVGGTANSVTKRARTERRFSELRVSYGSWANSRTTFDHNQPIAKTFAVRLNALYQDREGWRDFDFEKRKSLTLAATWKPFPSTEVRAEAEKGRKSLQSTTTNFNDRLSGWDGRTTFNARIAANNAAAGVNRQGARAAVFTPSSGNVLVNYEGWGFTTASVATYLLNDFQINVPPDLYSRAIAGSHFRIPSRTFATTPDAPVYALENEDYTLSITHHVGERFFAEVAANVGKEVVDAEAGISRQLSQILIDVNSVLPTGEPNPNFLEPYGQGTGSYPYQHIRDKVNLRLALGYALERTRLGDFKFNLLAGTSTSDFDRSTYRYMLKTHADPRQWPTFAPVLFRYYINTDTARPMPRPDSWTYIDPITGARDTVAAGIVRDYTNNSGNQINNIDYTYAQVATTAKLMKGRLNIVGAMRRDGFKTHQESQVAQFDNPVTWDGVARNLKPAAPSDWSGLTYRMRDASGNPVGPALPAEVRPRVNNLQDARYASDRFQDDYSPPDVEDTVDTFTVGSVFHVAKRVAVFANYAQSFIPPRQALKIDGSLFQQQASEGWDYGLRLTLAEGAVVANIIRYEGREDNRPIGGFGTDFTAIIEANPVGDTTPAGLNKYGLRPTPTGYNDSAAVQTKGWELEVTANLTPNWRLLFNGATPKAYQTNPNKESFAYLATHDQTLRNILNDAGVTIDANDFASPTTPSSEGPAAAQAWNRLQDRKKSTVTAPQQLTRVTELTANLYTDYRFRRGWLNGLRVGGGINYRGRQIIGNRGADTIRDPANPSQAIDDPSVGPLDPVYTEPYATGTLTFGYTRKIGKRYTLGLDLKIDNLFDYDKPLFYTTIARRENGDLANPVTVTTPYRYSWLTPRNYMLTASLKF
ncbi:MAG: TonB-dependent receptor plug domain-containing protein [Verrucomicrobiota bacterium]